MTRAVAIGQVVQGKGGVSYTFWCFFLYDTYLDVS